MKRRPKRARPSAKDWRLLAVALRRWRRPMFARGLVVKHRLRPSDFPKSQLAAGIGVEMEHTGRPEVAMEIAMAHLFERPDYYARLEEMERSPVARDASERARRAKARQQKWISRKIRFLIDEGRPNKQAVAIAYSMWRKKSRGRT